MSCPLAKRLKLSSDWLTQEAAHWAFELDRDSGVWNQTPSHHSELSDSSAEWSDLESSDSCADPSCHSDKLCDSCLFVQGVLCDSLSLADSHQQSPHEILQETRAWPHNDLWTMVMQYLPVAERDPVRFVDKNMFRLAEKFFNSHVSWDASTLYMPAGARSLYNVWLNSPLLPTVKHCVLHSRFDAPVGMLVGMLPPSLLTLRFGASFNQPLVPGFLPASLQELDMGEEFDQDIEKGVLPASLRKIRFGLEYNFSRLNESNGVLPAELESLRFDDWRLQHVFRKGVLPPKICVSPLNDSPDTLVVLAK